MWLYSNFPVQLFRHCDISLLGLFRTAAQQDEHFRPPLDKIEPISGAANDPRLPNALTHGFDVSQIALFEPVNPHDDPRSRFMVFQLFQPIGKLGSLPDYHCVNLR